MLFVNLIKLKRVDGGVVIKALANQQNANTTYKNI